MSDKTGDQIREGLKLLAEDVQAPEGEAGRHARAWLLPRISPRLGLVLAAAAICATVGALAATGTFTGSHRAAAKGPVQDGGPMIPAMPPIPPVWIVAHRAADETLISLHVRIHSYTAHDNVQFQVVHSDPTGGDTVVYTKHVTTGDNLSSCPSGSTGASGPTGASGRRWECFSTGSEWSGTLVPSDWDGGCQSTGVYWIAVGSFHSETFMCDAVGPTGATGPTGGVGATG